MVKANEVKASSRKYSGGPVYDIMRLEDRVFGNINTPKTGVGSILKIEVAVGAYKEEALLSSRRRKSKAEVHQARISERDIHI